MKSLSFLCRQKTIVGFLMLFPAMGGFGQEFELHKLSRYQTPVPIPHSRIWYITHNLGATGARGWVFGGGSHTRDSREILVKSIEPGSPADGFLKPYDVIVGARVPSATAAYRWKSVPELRKFNQDARLSFSRALTWAESTHGKGVLELLCSRGGELIKVSIKIPVMGNYSGAQPLECEKSQRIAKNAADFLAEAMPVDGYQPGVGRPKAGLHLLGMMDARYLDHVRRTALRMSVRHNVNTAGHETWRWGNTNLFLCEYYLATGDKRVLPTIEEYSQRIAAGQCNPGTWGHRVVPDFIPPGYGSLNSSGVVCFLSLVLAHDIGVSKISEALGNSVRFFGSYAGKGSLPYGDHPPGDDATGTGKNGPAALAFHLLGSERISQWFARLCASTQFSNFEAGHSGNYFNQVWTPLASELTGAENYAAFWSRFNSYRDMARRRDGSFMTQPQPHGREGDLGSNNYVRKGPIWTTGGYALSYIAGSHNLAVLGRKESVFGRNAPSVLKPALDRYFAKDFEKAITLATEAGKQGDDRVKMHARQLIQISKLNIESLEMTLADMRESLREQDLLKIKLQLEGLGSIVEENDSRLSDFQKALNKPKAKEILADGKTYYSAIKSIAYHGPRGFESVTALGQRYDHHVDKRFSEILKKPRSPYQKLLKAYMKTLPAMRPKAELTLISLNRKDGDQWRIFSDSTRFPKRWSEYDFNDNRWDKLKTPTDQLDGKHLLRLQFNVKNPSKVDHLLLQQETAGLMKVYLNGELILNLRPQGGYSKHSRRSLILTPQAVSLLRKEKNVLAIAVDNTKAKNQRFDLGLKAALKDLDLKEIESKALKNYPEKVEPVPSHKEVSRLSDSRLIQLLKSWNPAIHKAVSKELATRSINNIADVIALSKSKYSSSRAGASLALGLILEYYLNPPRHLEKKPPTDLARKRLFSKYKIIPALVRLSKDVDLNVRRAAMDSCVRVGSSYPEITEAMISLTMDSDPHLAQESMIMLEKRFWGEAIKHPNLVPTLKRFFDTELPRGKGHMMRLIFKIPAAEQEQFFPQLLVLIKEKPMRDTMFGGGGKTEAIKILAAHGHKQLPEVLMGILDYSLRGMNPLHDALEAMRKYPKEDIEPFLPEIRRRHANLLEKIQTTRSKHEKKYAEADYDVITSFLNFFQ